MAGQLPFRITSPQPLLGLGRAGDGRFETLKPSTPAAVEKASKDAGRPLQAVAQEARTPDHAVPVGNAKNPATGGFRATLPWPDPNSPPGAAGYVGGLPVKFRSPS